MNGDDAYRLELQTAMMLAEAEGNIEAAEQYQLMIDEFDEYSEE